ncbi:MAG: hypothetical protein ACYC7D_11720 [Nitrososphaerales archaeon]
MGDQRSLIILELLLGISFGTLVLFSGSFFTIGIILLIITATVFAADREDLKYLGSSKTILAFIIVVTAFTVVGSLTLASTLGGYLFYLLTSVCFVLLISYSIIARAARSRADMDYR